MRAGIIASRPRLNVGLLILSLLLVLGLAWQAQIATRSNMATATRVLRDYASLVADEFARRAMSSVGYYGYYAAINGMRSSARASEFPDAKPAATTKDNRPSALALAAYWFRFDADSASLRFADGVNPARETQRFLMQLAEGRAQTALPESGFWIEHATIAGETHTFILSELTDGARVFGFEVAHAALAARLQHAFGQSALLPESLAGGAITNAFIYLQLADSSGLVLLASGSAYDPYLRINKTLGDEYGGIFRGYTISAAIDPAIAGKLVIGGLPRSRLPLLLAMIVLTVGLLITAIRQLHRERKLMQLRTGFVSEVSHELRTPLTQIRMFTETLLFDRVRSAQDRQRALEIINRESQRLIHLVENVLRFSNGQIKQRELHPQTHELSELVVNVVTEFQPLARAAHVKLDTDLLAGITVRVDRDALRQVLLNLLDNAVKYGPGAQHIQVRMEARPGWVRVSVADSGPGIPRQERERIWGGYYRLDRERESAIAGTGIGLAVVREIVALHGGTCWVEEAEAGGACFVVEIPTQDQAKASTEFDAIRTSPTAKLSP